MHVRSKQHLHIVRTLEWSLRIIEESEMNRLSADIAGIDRNVVARWFHELARCERVKVNQICHTRMVINGEDT